MKEVKRVMKKINKMVLFTLALCMIGIVSIRNVNAMEFSESIGMPWRMLATGEYVQIGYSNEDYRVYYQWIVLAGETKTQINELIEQMMASGDTDEIRNIMAQIRNLYPVFDDGAWTETTRAYGTVNSYHVSPGIFANPGNRDSAILWVRVISDDPLVRSDNVSHNAELFLVSYEGDTWSPRPWEPDPDRVPVENPNQIIESPDTFATSSVPLIGGASVLLGSTIIGVNLKKNKK